MSVSGVSSVQSGGWWGKAKEIAIDGAKVAAGAVLAPLVAPLVLSALPIIAVGAVFFGCGGTEETAPAEEGAKQPKDEPVVLTSVDVGAIMSKWGNKTLTICQLDNIDDRLEFGKGNAEDRYARWWEAAAEYIVEDKFLGNHTVTTVDRPGRPSETAYVFKNHDVAGFDATDKTGVLLHPLDAMIRDMLVLLSPRQRKEVAKRLAAALKGKEAPDPYGFVDKGRDYTYYCGRSFQWKDQKDPSYPDLKLTVTKNALLRIMDEVRSAAAAKDPRETLEIQPMPLLTYDGYEASAFSVGTGTQFQLGPVDFRYFDIDMFKYLGVKKLTDLPEQYLPKCKFIVANQEREATTQIRKEDVIVESSLVSQVIPKGWVFARQIPITVFSTDNMSVKTSGSYPVKVTCEVRRGVTSLEGVLIFIDPPIMLHVGSGTPVAAATATAREAAPPAGTAEPAATAATATAAVPAPRPTGEPPAPQPKLKPAPKEPAAKPAGEDPVLKALREMQEKAAKQQ